LSQEVTSELIAHEVAFLRLQPYDDLVSKLGVSESKELFGRDGNRYRVAIVIMWDSGKGGGIRVTVGIGGEGISAWRPVTATFVMAPNGTIDETVR
jgi:hypothetical protein